MKDKTLNVSEDDEVIVVELESTHGSDYGFCIAMDKFYNETSLSIVTPGPMNYAQFLQGLKEFIKDVETDQIDLEEVFNLNGTSRASH